jgi:thiol peroxidase
MVTFKRKAIQLSGQVPALHAKVPDFRLVDQNLKDHSLKDFQGKKKLLATVPSLDTSTCSLMTKHFNELAKKHPDIVLITVSADLPFAQKRFCQAEGVQNVLTLSMMRDKEFGKAYGVLIQEGPMAGLLTRAVFILDEKDHLLYRELVPEITQEPNYHEAVKALIPK